MIYKRYRYVTYPNIHGMIVKFENYRDTDAKGVIISRPVGAVGSYTVGQEYHFYNCNTLFEDALGAVTPVITI